MSRSLARLIAPLFGAVLAFAPYSSAAVDPPIPPDAIAVMQAIQNAAINRDWSALRSLMADEFLYDFGNVEEGADAAIRAWKLEPEVLDELQFVMEKRSCGFTYDTVWIRCQGKGGTHYRAGFKKLSGVWKMDSFVAGD